MHKIIKDSVNRYTLRAFVTVIVDPLTNVLSSDILKNVAAKSRQTAKPVTFQFQTRKWTLLACIYT